METVVLGVLFFLPALLANPAALAIGWIAKAFGSPFDATVDKVVTLGKKELFGANKTVAGCVAMVLAALAVGENLKALHDNFGFGPAVFDPVWKDAAFVWFLLGLGACCGDLAGSLCKRMLRIAPGENAWLVDQADWFLGAAVLLWLAGRLPSWDAVAGAALVLITLRLLLEIPCRFLFRNSQ